MIKFIKTEKKTVGVLFILIGVCNYFIYSNSSTILSRLETTINHCFIYGLTVMLFAVTLFPVAITMMSKVVVFSNAKEQKLDFKETQAYRNIVTLYQLEIIVSLVITALSFFILVTGWQYKVIVYLILIFMMISLYILLILSKSLIIFSNFKVED